MSTLKPTLSSQPSMAGGSPLSLFPLLLILAPLLTRAAIGGTTFPAWDMDPLLTPLPVNTLTPAGSLLIDALILLGSAWIFLTATLRNEARDRLSLRLAIIGGVAILLHGWFCGPHYGTLGNQRIGGAWLSAVFGALALAHAGRDPRVLRVVAATMLGFLMLLALRGVQQELWEHPQTVADFKANRERIFAAHGWTPGSASALGFERRALQPEATGWFGLSNVYASLAAAGVVAALGLLISRRLRSGNRDAASAPGRSAWTTLGLLTLLAACAIALSLSRSKGGILAAAVGIGTLFALHMLNRLARSRPRPARMLAMTIGALAILAPIALVLLRGVLADQLSELSLLFRSFYMHGAAWIFLKNPVVGVGPDDFQNAYLVAKPLLSTEDVTSPHSIVFDYLATLGMFGLAWVTLLLRWSCRIGAGALPALAPAAETVPSHSDVGTSPTRDEFRLIALIPALVTLAAVAIESPLLPPETALLRLVSGVVWGLAAWGLLVFLCRAPRAEVSIPFAATALTLMAHAQIEVTLSWSQSAGIVWAFFALAIASGNARNAGTRAPVPQPNASLAPKPFRPFVLPILLFACSALFFSAVRPAYLWQRTLIDAAESLHPIPNYNFRLVQLAKAPTAQPGVLPEDSLERIARDLSAETKTQVQANPGAIRAALAGLEPTLLPQAAELLVKARSYQKGDHRPLREASRLSLRLAEAAVAAGPTSASVQANFDRAIEVLPKARDFPSAADYRWAALVWERRARLSGMTDQDAIRAADISFQLAATYDPTNPDPALRLMRLHAAAGDAQHASIWAEEALARDALQRYDAAVRGLSDKDRLEAERLAKAPIP